MSVIINGLGMPQNIGRIVTIYPDGRVTEPSIDGEQIVGNAVETADVRGKWTMNSDFPDRLICTECGAQFDVLHWEAKQMHFCPNCGADMRPAPRRV